MISLADDGRRGDDTLIAFTALTFLTVAVTFLGVTGVDTLRAAVLRVRVLRGDATVIKWLIHLNSLILHGHGLYYENRYTMKQLKNSGRFAYASSLSGLSLL